MDKAKVVWSIIPGAAGAILLGGIFIPTVACGCLPAEETFLRLLREPETKRSSALLIDRASLLEGQPLRTPYQNFTRDRGVLWRLKGYDWCATGSAGNQIECTVRTEAGWFGVMEQYKRVRFLFGPDQQLNDVTVDSYVRMFGRTFDG